MLPFVNATLTAITAPGTSADYDTPAAAGAARWTGSTGVYVAEELIEVQSPGKVDEVVRTRVELPYDVGRFVERGDVLAYTYEDAPHERVARNITHAKLVGRIRVTLEDA